MKLIKTILFIFSLAILMLPIAEQQFKFFEFSGLKGAYFQKNKPEFSDSSWFSAVYQKKYEEYIVDTIGFRNILIRIYNQLDYSLFNKLNAYDIVVGKNNTLQATTHFDAYLGKLNVKYRSADSLAFKLKKIQDTLSKQNKFIFFVFAPSKGSFDIDNAPYWYDKTKKSQSQYEKYKMLFEHNAINYFDFNELYLKNKSQSEYPLYSNYGIHWARWSVVNSFDTLLKFIESRSNFKTLPNITNIKISESDLPNPTDIDLTSSLNLLIPFKFNQKFYDCSFNIDTVNTVKKNMMIISDSYYWLFNSYGLAEHTSNEVSFWYYYSTVYKKNATTSYNAQDLNVLDEINKNDIIFIMATSTNLDNPGWGFIDNAYSIYFKN